MTVTTRRKFPTRIGNITVVPPLASEIFVSWRSDTGDVEWWKAIVTEVATAKKGRVVGTGSLMYEARGVFKDSVSHVEFLHSERNGRTVREVGSKSSECAWKMEGDCDNVERNDALNQSDVKQDSTLTEHGLNGKATFDAESSGGVKESQSDQHCPSHKSKRRKVAPSNHGDLDRLIVEQNDTNRASNPQQIPDQHNLAQIMSAMASNYVLSGPSTNVRASSDGGHLSVIKAELKYLLAEKLSANLVHSSASRCTPEGAVVQRLYVSSRCSLHWFSDLVNDINETIRSEELADLNCISFIPELRLLQKPSLASTDLHVYFPTFESLCCWLNFREPLDISKMLIRRKSSDKDPMIRVLGSCHSMKMATKTNEVTYNGALGVQTQSTHILSDEADSSDKDHQTTEPNEKPDTADDQIEEGYYLDRVLIGISRPHSDDEKGNEMGTSSSKNEEVSDIKSYSNRTLLQQHRLNWDDSQGRYIDKWEMKKERFNLTWTKDESKRNALAMTQCIFLSWKRSSQLPERRLSSDASSTGNIVLGSVEISIPAVLFVGMNTCEDVSKILNEC